MTFTVLGASGVIGNRLVSSLHEKGETVFAPLRGDKKIFSRHLKHVIYAIGVTADFRNHPFETVDSHVSLVSKILRHAKFNSFLYLSSSRIYSGASSGNEDAEITVYPHDKSELYNISKLMGEALCFSCDRPKVRVARLSNVVGGNYNESKNFLPTLFREAKSGCIKLHTAMSSAKDYIHIDDVVNLLPRIALEGRETIYNVASGQQITHAEWCEKLKDLTGCDVKVAPNVPRIKFVNIDISHIRNEFNFDPRPVFSILKDWIANTR